MTSVQAKRRELIGGIAVLCGVEALSAQQRAVGANSFCVNVCLHANADANEPMGRVAPNEFAKPMTVSREQG
jgi:hypothetical protein